MSVSITFLGGSGTVTGSKYLVRHNGKSMLMDCGLFQGYKQLRLRNWQPLPLSPHEIDSVVLTHAHLDHSGYLPLLARRRRHHQRLLQRARQHAEISCLQFLAHIHDFNLWQSGTIRT